MLRLGLEIRINSLAGLRSQGLWKGLECLWLSLYMGLRNRMLLRVKLRISLCLNLGLWMLHLQLSMLILRHVLWKRLNRVGLWIGLSLRRWIAMGWWMCLQLGQRLLLNCKVSLLLWIHLYLVLRLSSNGYLSLRLGLQLGLGDLSMHAHLWLLVL
jgi:hypothetical protein